MFLYRMGKYLSAGDSFPPVVGPLVKVKEKRTDKTLFKAK
jgi:hypothetical protein